MYKSSLASFVRLFQACLSEGNLQPGDPAPRSRRGSSTPEAASLSAVEDRLARLTPALQVRPPLLVRLAATHGRSSRMSWVGATHNPHTRLVPARGQDDPTPFLIPVPAICSESLGHFRLSVKRSVKTFKGFLLSHRTGTSSVLRWESSPEGRPANLCAAPGPRHESPLIPIGKQHHLCT